MTPAAGIPLKEPAISAAATDAEQLERARIDASTRVPVLMFYASAMVWLLIGTLLAGFVSFKLHSPDWFSDVSFLTWGRLRPIHMNVMVYGWASMAAMGTAVWMMARLCRTTLRHPLLIVAGAWFWNIGILIGIIAILMGYSTGYQWLEFPPYAALVMFVAYALIMSWAVLMFRFRRGEQIYITQWYLLGAFLWFPWVYAAAQAMLFIVPVQGVLQAAVSWWYANNLMFLWLGAIALGTAYYMIPKVIGRPVYSYHLATIGFWTYALFSSWTGMQRLVDGPFPAWMITASIAATILTIIPVATVGLNHHMTMQGYFPVMRYSPTLRFTVLQRRWNSDFAADDRAISAFHRGQRSLHPHRAVRVCHDDPLRIDVLHHPPFSRPGMALRDADQTPFLGVRLRSRIDVADAAGGRFCSGR
jgi:cytochrome c oxidase cbb3-type subunit 1